MQYPNPIKESVKALCNELCKHYPNIFNQTYDNAGFPVTGGSLFESRMEMGVYIELIKSGETFDNAHRELDIVDGKVTNLK